MAVKLFGVTDTLGIWLYKVIVEVNGLTGTMKDGPELANTYMQVWSNRFIFNRSFIFEAMLCVENHTLSSEINHICVVLFYAVFKWI